MNELMIVAPGKVNPFPVKYMGIIPESNFMTYESLTAALTPSRAFAKQTGYKYFEFLNAENKTIIVPSHPIGTESYLKIYEKGATTGSGTAVPVPQGAGAAVDQNKTVTVGQNSYRVRLMSGVPGDTYPTGDTINIPDFIPVQEYDYFIPNIWVLSENIKAAINFKDIGIPENVKVAKVNYTTSTRSGALVRGSRGSFAMIRGRFDTSFPDTDSYPFKFVQFSAGYTQLSATGTGVWWPVFEKI